MNGCSRQNPAYRPAPFFHNFDEQLVTGRPTARPFCKQGQHVASRWFVSTVRKFVVRLPDDLHSRIGEASKRYRRSMNSEIVTRLDHSLKGLPGAASETKVEPAFFQHLETTFRRDLSDQEDAMIRLFRRLSKRQREALVTLLEG